ncbi:hypothetical protein D3C78_689660 [compost metagenome]
MANGAISVIIRPRKVTMAQITLVFTLIVEPLMSDIAVKGLVEKLSDIMVASGNC